MKTNIITALLVGVSALCSTSCGNPEQKIRLKVIDESGAPIQDAKCTAGWWKDVFVHDTTNADGLVEFQGRTGMTDTMVRATAPGYYKSEIIRFLMDTTKGKPSSRWEPWPVELTFVMKKIIRPHPMYFVTKYDGALNPAIPGKAMDQEFGYDLIERDWVAPHGKGKTADFLITASHEKPGDTGNQPHGWVRLRFSNPQDGIIEYKNASSGGSILEGPHEAPETGYQPEFKFPNWFDDATQNLRKEHKWSHPMYVFRVRTVTDPSGKVINSRYGKLPGGVYGWLSLRRPRIELTYYLNGTDNDRGLEWDMKNNLFKDLQGKVALMNGNKP